MYIIRNARLISELTEGFEVKEGVLADIEIEDGMISAIRPAGTVPQAQSEYDALGKTVMPGMFDLHMHLHFRDMDEGSDYLKSQTEFVIDGCEYAREQLRQGFTTVRSCGEPYDDGFIVRGLADSGLLTGPKIFTCGKIIAPTTRGNDLLSHIANGPEELRKACREEYARGADFLKYYGTGSVGSANGVPGALISSKEEIDMLQKTADDIGVTAAVHCHGKSCILLCADAGIRTIEHASYIDDECIELILKKGSRSAIVPTLGPIGLMRSGFMTEVSARKVREQEVEGMHPMVEASRAGVLTGWGTDVSRDFFTEHPGAEFSLRKERGYTNIEMLEQATINSAKILGTDDVEGTVCAGKRADLLIIDGEPDCDIAAMFRHAFRVYKSGQLVSENGVVI